MGFYTFSFLLPQINYFSINFLGYLRVVRRASKSVIKDLTHTPPLLFRPESNLFAFTHKIYDGNQRMSFSTALHDLFLSKYFRRKTEREMILFSVRIDCQICFSWQKKETIFFCWEFFTA